MNDVISRSAAFAAIQSAHPSGKRSTYARLIGQLPALDAVPVVRCMACAWRSSTGFCGRQGHPVSDDFFCAHGTNEIIKKPGPAKKTEKKTEERCLATGLACSRCVPGPCDHRKTST